MADYSQHDSPIPHDLRASRSRKLTPAREKTIRGRFIGREEAAWRDEFNTRCIHEVPAVQGRDPRIVLATFIGYSPEDPEVAVWS